MKRFAIVAVMVAVIVCCGFDNDGCGGPPTSDEQQAAQQEKLSQESNAQVGMPGITNFTEKKIVRKLYELRDQSIATHAYVMDMNGRLFHVCESIGYGLPYGVQYDNPEVYTWMSQSSGWQKLPQSEPNGLFMPPTAEGTWVICADQKHPGQIAPIYIELRVIVSPFPLKAVGEWQP